LIPRGAQAEKELHGEASKRLMRARTPEDALAVVLRLLLAQRLVDTDGLPGADRQGVYEPQELAGSKVLAKLAKRVAPPSVKQHLAEQEAERERREQAWRAPRSRMSTRMTSAIRSGELGLADANATLTPDLSPKPVPRSCDALPYAAFGGRVRLISRDFFEAL
jgi:hypothetical protein